MVLPAWLLDSDESLRRLVVWHEREHVRAGDARLLLCGLVLAMLLPWCLPLWWQLHRLGAAVETDCDARVLAAGAPARQYARALLAVARGPGYGHRYGRLAGPALVPARGELERRIGFITGRPRDRSSVAGPGLVAAAMVVAVGLGAVPVPDPPRVLSPDAPPATPDVPPGATVIFSVVGEPPSDGPAAQRRK